MICHDYKCLFVHVPKTAGQSIETVFLHLSGLSWRTRGPLLLRPNRDPSKGPPRLAHLTASEYLELGYIPEALFRSYFTFSFVRNPWDRLVSEYKYRHVGKCSFKTFLFKRFPSPAEDSYSSGIDAYRHILPQYKFVYDDTGKRLVDFIGYFENLQHDFDHVTRRLGLPHTKLPVINTSPHRHGATQRKIKDQNTQQQYELAQSNTKATRYGDYYDSESRAFVECMYKKDIEIFNYEFLP